MPPVSLNHLLKLAMTLPCPSYVHPELHNMTSFVNSAFTEVKVENLKMKSFWIYKNDLWCLYEEMEREICTREEGGRVKIDSEISVCFLPSQGPPGITSNWWSVKRIILRLPRGMILPTQWFQTSASRNLGGYISVIFRHQFVVICYNNFRKLKQIYTKIKQRKSW